MEELRHELAAVVWHGRGGYRARCVCRWTSARYTYPEGARRSWVGHVTRASDPVELAGILDRALRSPRGRPSARTP